MSVPLTVRERSMRILVYKRTHIGDPDGHGRFGINTCMGKVRGLEYDAVIGIGALTAEARSYGIAGRINWVGIGPHKDWSEAAIRIDQRGPQVEFDRFERWEDDGPMLIDCAPMLARRFYERKARYVLTGLTDEEHREACGILALLGNHVRPARERSGDGCSPRKRRHGCPPNVCGQIDTK